MRKFHYTHAHRIDAILSDGLIKPATKMLDPGERPAVWISGNPFWEYTVCCMTPWSLLSYIGLWRIEIMPDAAPVHWTNFRRQAGMSNRTAKFLERSAIAIGASPLDWYASFDPIPRDKWVAVERMIETPDSYNWISAHGAMSLNDSRKNA